MVTAAALSLVTIFAAARTLHHDTAVSPLAIGLALLPGIAVLLMLVAIGRLLFELEDEYLRLLEVRKSLIATGVTLAVTSIWGLLDSFTTAPHLCIF